jgi:hypothetical protein
MLKLAQLLGQLGFFLTLAVRAEEVSGWLVEASEAVRVEGER